MTTKMANATGIIGVVVLCVLLGASDFRPWVAGVVTQACEGTRTWINKPPKGPTVPQERWVKVCTGLAEGLQKDLDGDAVAEGIVMMHLLKDSGCDPRLAAGYVNAAERAAARCDRADVAMRMALADQNREMFKAAAAAIDAKLCPVPEWWWDDGPGQVRMRLMADERSAQPQASPDGAASQ